MSKGRTVHCRDPLSRHFVEEIGSALDDPEASWIAMEFEEKSDPDLEIERVLSGDLRALRQSLRQLESGLKPVVALIGKTISGLDLEVALACHFRLAAGKEVEIGYSWLQFGLMPFLGSTQRLPWLTSLKTAADLLLFGEPISFADLDRYSSFKIGKGDLRAAGADWAALNPSPKQPWDEKASASNPLTDHRQELEQIYLQLRRRTTPKEEAPTAILRCFYEGLERSFDAGVRLEEEIWDFLQAKRSAANRRQTLYFTKREAKRARPVGVPIKHLGVLGAGLMGTGIAYTAARAGLEVTLVDVTEEALLRSGQKIKKLFAQDRRAQSLEPFGRLQDRIKSSTEIKGLTGCDFVIEAVFEEAETKRTMLRQIAALTDVTLASNTTTFPIADLAKACQKPDRFIGTHFFAPVERMELLEIVVGQETAKPTLEKALQLASQLDKTPLTVRDGPGFFTSRVVMAYIQEALFLVREGVAPWLIDNVAQNAGMPIGPLTMADLTGLDLLLKIFESLAAHGRGVALYAGETIEILHHFLGRSRLGKKARAGIYDYTPDREGWPYLEKIFPARRASPSFEEIEERLFAIQTIETQHAMREGVIQEPKMADLGSVLGWSYPPFLGGVASYAVQKSDFQAVCERLRLKLGERFTLPGTEGSIAT